MGVAIDSLEDMETLLDGIPLERVSTSMTINATAAILLALYIAVARRRGIARGRAVGHACRTTSSRSTSRAAPTSTRRAPSLRLVTDVFAYCAAARAALEHDLDLGLSHPRGGRDGAAGDRVHLRATRSSTCARRGAPGSTRALRRAPLVLLRLPLRLHRGGREVPRRAPAVGAADARAPRRAQPEGAAAALPRADRAA